MIRTTERFACPLCGYTAATLPVLKKHVRANHHPVCLACGKRCKTWGGVVLHLLGTASMPHTHEEEDARALTWWLAARISRGRQGENANKRFHRGQDVALDTLEVVA